MVSASISVERKVLDKEDFQKGEDLVI